MHRLLWIHGTASKTRTFKITYRYCVYCILYMCQYTCINMIQHINYVCNSGNTVPRFLLIFSKCFYKSWKENLMRGIFKQDIETTSLWKDHRWNRNMWRTFYFGFWLGLSLNWCCICNEASHGFNSTALSAHPCS